MFLNPGHYWLHNTDRVASPRDSCQTPSIKTRRNLLLTAVANLGPATAFSWVGLTRLLQREQDACLRSVQETVWAAAVKFDTDVSAAQASLRVFANSRLLKRVTFQHCMR